MVQPAKTDWRLVWLLWAAGLGAAAQYGKISVVFDQLPQIYPDAGASLGFAVSLVGALGIALGIVAGVLVAQIGYRRALLGALCTGAAMSLMQAAFPPLPLFLASRIVEGGAHLAIVVAAPTLIAQLATRKDRGVALTLWGTFFGVAFAILAWVGLPLVAAYELGSLLLAHAAYLVLMALVLGRLLPPGADTAAPRIGLTELLQAHARLYRSAYIGAPALGWLFYTLCFVSVLTVFPPFLAPDIRALVIGAMPLMSILSSLTLGVLMLRYIAPVSVIVIGFFTCAVCAALLWLLPGQPLVALALGAGLGLVQGASFAAVPDLNEAPAEQALANGGLAQMGNIGNTSGTPIMVAVIAGFGYGGLMATLGALFLGGAAMHLILRARRRRI